MSAEYEHSGTVRRRRRRKRRRRRFVAPTDQMRQGKNAIRQNVFLPSPLQHPRAVKLVTESLSEQSHLRERSRRKTLKLVFLGLFWDPKVHQRIQLVLEHPNNWSRRPPKCTVTSKQPRKNLPISAKKGRKQDKEEENQKVTREKQ
jgi:hypothetical protein